MRRLIGLDPAVLEGSVGAVCARFSLNLNDFLVLSGLASLSEFKLPGALPPEPLDRVKVVLLVEEEDDDAVLGAEDAEFWKREKERRLALVAEEAADRETDRVLKALDFGLSDE